MNPVPPGQDPPEDIDEHYRRATAQDLSRPSESVRRAVLERAAQLAAERSSESGPVRANSPRPQARRHWWRPALVGSLAAATLAGLLVTPRFLQPEPSPNVSAETPHKKALIGEIRPLYMSQNGVESLKSREVPAPRSAAPRSRAAPQADALQAGAQTATRAAAAQIAPQAAPQAAPGASAAMRAAGRQADPAAALRQAAEIGDVAGLKTLLARTSDIDARDEKGRTALMLATVHGEAGAVDVLLAHGADPNAADASGTTPVQAAMALGQPAIAAALQRAGAR